MLKHSVLVHLGLSSTPTNVAAFDALITPIDPKIGKERQPYAIALADRHIMALTGLWETWRSPAGETVRSFTVITTEPNELCEPIHNRMPVILDPTSWQIWLGEEAADSDDLKAMLVPYPAAGMTS